jgi:hypothetical protein
MYDTRGLEKQEGIPLVGLGKSWSEWVEDAHLIINQQSIMHVLPPLRMISSARSAFAESADNK